MLVTSDLFRGTGMKLTQATIILAGISSLVASLLSLVSIWHQAKNYRKPLLQRYVIRILLMVPIYSLSSWSSIVSHKASIFLDPVRDVYEAFTIYTFFQLLINFIGGERALIIMMHGKEPVNHVRPMKYCLPKVDISDPHTFLAIKRGILQYAWLKPILGFITIIMKATGTYREGYLGLNSGYLWSGIAYNLSVTISLYSLGLFWICMSKDLQPFRPLPKFLCVKLIIFASYWQGFFLSVLVWLGAIPDNVEGYTSDNLASAIQNALICIEMPIFAIGHWYAFSWHDYADVTISAARMPIKYALRDAFGVRDLIEDSKETFSGNQYKYRLFDPGDNILAHEGSSSRVARMMEGMRYERSGNRKYWIPKPGEVNARTPLLPNDDKSDRPQSRLASRTLSKTSQCILQENDELEEQFPDADEESLYERARALEYGDWNYPVITAYEVSRDRYLNTSPEILISSANHPFLQPIDENQTRQSSTKSKLIQEITLINQNSKQSKLKQKEVLGLHNSRSRSYEFTRKAPDLEYMQHPMPNFSSAESNRAQFADFRLEGSLTEDTGKMKARKKNSSSWNGEEPEQCLHTYGKNSTEEIRKDTVPSGNINVNFLPYNNREKLARTQDNRGKEFDSLEESQQWEQEIQPQFLFQSKRGLFGEAFDNVWIATESLEEPTKNP